MTHRNKIIRISIAAMIVAIMAVWLNLYHKPLRIEITLKSDAGTMGEIFYLTDASGYSPDQRVSFRLEPGLMWKTYKIDIPASRALRRIRFDPGNAPGTIAVNQINLTASGGAFEIRTPQISRAIKNLNQIRILSEGSKELLLESLGQDPYFDFEVPSKIFQVKRSQKFIWFLEGFLLGAMIWGLLEFMATWCFLYGPRIKTYFAPIHSCIKQIASRVSDDRTIVFKPGSVYIVLVTFVLAVTFIAFKLNQSSIGAWNTYYPEENLENGIAWGVPKKIRSDEWLVQTPWALNQVQLGAPIHNENIGALNSALITAVPVAHLTLLAQPKYWGFFFFELERGFSWWWAYKAFGLFLSFFLLCLLLTRGQTLASLAGTLMIYGSSFVQWWFSSNLAEELIGFACAVIGAVYLLQARGGKGIYFGAGILVFAVINLILHLYPPFLVPLAYLAMAILIGLFIEPNRLAWCTESGCTRTIAVLLCLGMLGVILAVYVLDSWPTMKLVMDTVYPGQRTPSSGDMPLSRIFYGYFEWLRKDENVFPFRLKSNASEASNFLLIFPFILVMYPIRALMKRENGLVLALLAYCFLLLIWMSVPLPPLVLGLLNSVGWSMTSPQRALLGLGIASTFAVTVYIAAPVNTRPDLRRTLMGLVVFVLVATYGWHLSVPNPIFFTKERIFWGAAATSMIVLALVYRDRLVLLLTVAAIITPSLTVNPLVSGLGPILDKPVLRIAKELGGSPGDKWAVISNPGLNILAQGMKAHGLRVVNGTEFVPDREKLAILDPSGQYINTWNRYAHVSYTSDPRADVPVFKLTNTDQYNVAISVCSGILHSLGVTHVAFVVKPPTSDLRCLSALPTDPQSGVYLYRLTTSDQSGGNISVVPSKSDQTVN